MVTTVTSKAEYDSAVSTNKVVVVDFYATWCGPCKMISPKLEELSKTYTNVTFIKVDVDELPDVAQIAEVKAMPTFHIFVGGERSAVIVGADYAKLKAAVEKAAQSA